MAGGRFFEFAVAADEQLAAQKESAELLGYVVGGAAWKGGGWGRGEIMRE